MKIIEGKKGKSVEFSGVEKRSIIDTFLKLSEKIISFRKQRNKENHSLGLTVRGKTFDLEVNKEFQKAIEALIKEKKEKKRKKTEFIEKSSIQNFLFDYNLLEKVIDEDYDEIEKSVNNSIKNLFIK